MSDVRVIHPVAIDAEAIRRTLGVDPLPVEHVSAPSILVGGRYHVAGSRWLLRKHNIRPVEATTLAHARRLAGWIRNLRTERGLDSTEQFAADVFVATEEDMFAYYRQRQFDERSRVSSATWKAELSTIKQFHEWMHATYRVPLPFRLTTFRTRTGQRRTTAHELRPRRRQASAGTPLTPGFASLLVQGAQRVDMDGVQADARTVDRDAGLVGLGLSTGMRLGSLTDITTYEIPALTRQPFSIISVPDFITKGDAGGQALVFTNRLKFVHIYIDGDRAATIAEGRSWKPPNPVHIVDANDDYWVGMLGEERLKRRWAETTSHWRRRLVNPDGSTPIVWLDTRTADPIQYDTAGGITSQARDWTRQHILPDFPATLTTHDLRHTYATHLAVCIFKQAVAPHVAPDLADAYQPARVADAVEMAKLSLGHVSDDSTRLYIQQAPKFLHIDIDEFLGGGA